MEEREEIRTNDFYFMRYSSQSIELPLGDDGIMKLGTIKLKNKEKKDMMWQLLVYEECSRLHPSSPP